jgi:hypothetical protein
MTIRLLLFALLTAVVAVPTAAYANVATSTPMPKHGHSVKPAAKATPKATACPKKPCAKPMQAAPSHM